MAEARITGTGPAELKLLAAKLKTADRRLRTQLRRGLRDAAGPAAEATQKSILAMPSRHAGGLRAEVAATVTTRVSVTGRGIRVEIVAEPQKMPAGKQSLPGHLNSARGWGHPTFGHRDRWVRQEGKPAWFEAPVTAHARDFQRQAQQAVDATAAFLTGAI